MKNTDKFYEIDCDTVFDLKNRIIDAIPESSEKHHLCAEDIDALARFLSYRLEAGDDNGQYETVVDFLWMSSRIEFNHKMLLLDLVNE